MLFKLGQTEYTYANVFLAIDLSKIIEVVVKNVYVHMALRIDCQKRIFQYLLNMILALYLLFTCHTPPQCLVFYSALKRNFAMTVSVGNSAVF